MKELRVNPEWAKLPLFDRKGWKRVRFGDVVENVNETCDPSTGGSMPIPTGAERKS